MEMPEWRAVMEDLLELLRARQQPCLMQLATLRAAARPAVRTIVFRGWADDGLSLLVTADLRSAKIDQLRQHPWGELCCCSPDWQQQLRILGTVGIGGPDAPAWEAPRSRIWHELPREVQAMFWGPTPGQPLATAQGSLPPAGGSNQPPATFGLLILEPHEVDQLRINTQPHQRTRHRRDPSGGWHAQAINP